MTSPPGSGKTDPALFNRHLSDIACYAMLKTGAKREPVLQEPLPGVLDHRTFTRTKVELGRCDVCGTGKAVYRSREARAKVCEERLSRRGRSSSIGGRCRFTEERGGYETDCTGPETAMVLPSPP